ncbi:MAG: AEC family transporter [Methanobacterium sp.]
MNSIETIIPILLMIVIGYALRRFKVFRPDDAIILNKIVIYIAIPSLIFLALYNINLSILPVIAPITVICIIIGVFCGLISFLFAKINNYSRETRWSIILTSAMFNSGLLGYPFVLGVFGIEGLVRAVFFDLGSMILFILFGILLLFIYGGKYQDVLKRIFIFPPLWAVIIALFLNYLNLDIGFLATNTLKYLSGAAIPLIMISLGLSIEFRGIKENFKVIFSVSIIKLIIAPLIASIIVLMLGMGGLERQVTIIEAAMPSAMVSLILSITYDLDIKITAACIFASTILSLVTIPLILLIIT